jgi:DNA-binding IclR family transcriptional regulator
LERDLMKKPTKTRNARDVEPATSSPNYSAPALEKGLDILETLCRSNVALSQSEIAERLGRSVGELYRMLICLVNRNYVVNLGETYAITTKIFALAHSNPPTNRLLAEAGPIMQELSSGLEQACHLTVYNDGRQVVIAKVDNPSGLGFSVRVGADLDVLASASGRVLLAFQDEDIRELRIKESLKKKPEHYSRDIDARLEATRLRGYESIDSTQVKGLHAVCFPVLDTQSHAIAALIVPYAERLDIRERKSHADVERMLSAAARALSERIGWRNTGVDRAVWSSMAEDAQTGPAPKRTRRALSK